MCMGMMNYREPKEELTVISCRKCGRAWQVTEIDAEFFSNHRGICPECRKKSKEKVSLLKPHTQFEKIKAMNLDEMAEFIDTLTSQCDPVDCRKCPLFDVHCGGNNIKQWLESEAKE